MAGSQLPRRLISSTIRSVEKIQWKFVREVDHGRNIHDGRPFTYTRGFMGRCESLLVHSTQKPTDRMYVNRTIQTTSSSSSDSWNKSSSAASGVKFLTRQHHGTVGAGAEAVSIDGDNDEYDDFDEQDDLGSQNESNHFELFSQPATFRIDLVDLKRRYHKLMTEHHPDKQRQDNRQMANPISDLDDDGSVVVHLSANDITDAYQTLVSYHTRATYLLDAIYHRPLLEHDENDNMLVGMCFLMDMMEWRERIEELESDYIETNNDTNNADNEDKDNAIINGSLHQRQQEELKKIWDETQDRQNHCVENLNTVFDELAKLQTREGRSTRDENQERLLQDARKFTAQIQYWHRLESTIREKMDV